MVKLLHVLVATNALDNEEKARQNKRFHLAVLLRLRMLVRERNYLSSSALCSSNKCAWLVMYASRLDASFIKSVSIPPRAYDRLLAAFSHHYRVLSGPGRRGRPPRFVSINCVLACLLHFYTAAVEHKTLCALFGVPPSTLSRATLRGL